MFDFAVTRKPILFFTYDLESYRDQLRGFYFDFERDAPGPLLSETSDLAKGLRELDAVSSRYALAYDRFFARFCALEDGQASARVIESFFG
jgi:CDP-glycerol glycerophosphotransferase